MRNSFALAALAVLSAAAMPTIASAQTFEKKNYNYSEWTKGRFSEAVTVIGPGKMIFLAGVGSEDESGKGGDILYKGDFTAQMAEIAIVVAVAQSCLKIAQVLCSNGVTAQGAVAVLKRAVVPWQEGLPEVARWYPNTVCPTAPHAAACIHITHRLEDTESNGAARPALTGSA
jgi:hypothetical protein